MNLKLLIKMAKKQLKTKQCVKWARDGWRERERGREDRDTHLADRRADRQAVRQAGSRQVKFLRSYTQTTNLI